MQKKETKYLVRPHDFHIFETDPLNGCYRSYEIKEIKNRPNAYAHFTFENLTENYDFFTITEDQILEYKEKHKAEMGFTIWQTRNEMHGGVKGGTREEYKEYLEKCESYKKWKESK